MLPVLIVTKTYSTSLGVIRSLGSAGYHVELLYIVSKPGRSRIAASSKYVKRTIEYVGRNEEGLISLIKTTYDDDGRDWIVIPTDDFTASVIDRYRDVLGPKYKSPYIVDGSAGDIHRLMDKDHQCKLAQSCGLNVPQSSVIDLRNDTIVIPDSVRYPCYVKPLVSYKGAKTEMAKCESRNELEIRLNKMRQLKSDRMVLIQEFLDISQEYSMSGLCFDQEIILPAVTKKLRIAQYQNGVTMSGVMTPVEELESIASGLSAFLKSLRFVGMFDLEIMVSNGVMYFGEVNMRPGGPNYFYYCNGVNLPAILAQALEEGFVKSEVSCALGTTFLYEKVAWEDYRFGYLSKKELDELYASSDYLLLDVKDDPWPGRRFLRFIKPRAICTRLMHRLGR